MLLPTQPMLNSTGAVALYSVMHGIFTYPILKNSAIDFLDGEKVFVEICCALIAVFGFLRWRVAVRRAQVH
ncbi:MAG: hypothetical protein ACRD4K_07080 [Candidatus Acidiferrales bacterium]